MEKNKEEFVTVFARGDNKTSNVLLLGWTFNDRCFNMHKKEKTRADVFLSFLIAGKTFDQQQILTTFKCQFDVMQNTAVAAVLSITTIWNVRQEVSGTTTNRVCMNSFRNAFSSIQANWKKQFYFFDTIPSKKIVP